MTRPSNERDGECICDYGPGTDGPDEMCPFHGRPYTYWAEGCGHLSGRLDRIRECVDRWDAQYEEDDESGSSINPFYMIEDLRSILAGGEPDDASPTV